MLNFNALTPLVGFFGTKQPTMIDSLGYVLVDTTCSIPPDPAVTPIETPFPDPIFEVMQSSTVLSSQQIMWIAVGCSLTFVVILAAGLLGYYCKKKQDFKVNELILET